MNSSSEPGAASFGAPPTTAPMPFHRPRKRQPYVTCKPPRAGSPITEWHIGRETYFSP